MALRSLQGHTAHFPQLPGSLTKSTLQEGAEPKDEDVQRRFDRIGLLRVIFLAGLASFSTIQIDDYRSHADLEESSIDLSLWRISHLSNRSTDGAKTLTVFGGSSLAANQGWVRCASRK